MKYMGSKRAMLQNGLGELLRDESAKHDRIVDFFCGSASVAWFAAQDLQAEVFALDLQKYATILANAVISRTQPLDPVDLRSDWLTKAKRKRTRLSSWPAAVKLDGKELANGQWNVAARKLCRDTKGDAGPIWRAYGGYYFSPTQALAFDAMIESLPTGTVRRSVCLAALIMAASKCAASPGHTAQPFAANKSAGPFMREAWLRDPFEYVQAALNDLCPRHATKKGYAIVGDANDMADDLRATDLVFLDPPYSGVHYSRFYHVLETIARGDCGDVSGSGRYPPPSERPVSTYSRQSESLDALDELLEMLAERQCTVVMTFPSGKCSNGLSGSLVLKTAKQYFDVVRKNVKTRFSTLGGDNNHREARQLSDEMILVLRT